MTSRPTAPTSPGDEPSGRQRLLDVGAALLAEHGYADTTLRQVAREAGMKAGSIYYHFDSKDQLLTEVLRLGMTAVTDAFDEAVGHSRDTADPLVRLHAVVQAHLRALFEFGPYTATHVTAFHYAPKDVRSGVLPLRDAYEAKWQNLLDDLVADGALAATNTPRVRRLHLLDLMNSAIHWFDPTGTETIDDLANSIVELFWVGATNSAHSPALNTDRNSP